MQREVAMQPKATPIAAKCEARTRSAGRCHKGRPPIAAGFDEASTAMWGAWQHVDAPLGDTSELRVGRDRMGERYAETPTSPSPTTTTTGHTPDG
jgi:hypothetical protein